MIVDTHESLRTQQKIKPGSGGTRTHPPKRMCLKAAPQTTCQATRYRGIIICNQVAFYDHKFLAEVHFNPDETKQTD